ncbi:MAG: DNA-binding transcriptional regulator OxyR [Gammaproteobacteria bacterium]|nr:MAG: DNA-binding transcriptional regulator OxyR [Gammaproteobacteria bacterium]RLA22985.1 MAG: DNA-binding transcriptional regulator OxyR [Gammaproteobacteria bacterium]
MNLRDLKYIVAVAHSRSFVQAAESCFVSQPTLSTQIKKLERDLGVKLFERTNKKVMLTKVGKSIVASAQSILDEVERMKALAANAQDPLAGELRLGAFPSLASYLFPSLVSVIKKELPKIKLILIEEKTNTLIGQLERGEIDAALLSLPLKEDFLVSQPLFDDAFELAVAVDHPLAKKQKTRASALQGQQLLLLDEGHCMRDQALQFCQWSGAEEQLGVRAASLETLRQMVIAGTGVTLMPEIAINKEDRGICYIPFEAPVPKRTIGVVWRKSSVRGQLMAQLVELFKIEMLSE